MKITDEDLRNMGIGPSHFEATLWVCGAMVGMIILMALGMYFAAKAAELGV